MVPLADIAGDVMLAGRTIRSYSEIFAEEGLQLSDAVLSA